MARVHSKASDAERAVEYQIKAVEQMENLDKFQDTEYLADMFMTLSEYQDKAG
jgi:hypothetical protein